VPPRCAAPLECTAPPRCPSPPPPARQREGRAGHHRGRRQGHPGQGAARQSRRRHRLRQPRLGPSGAGSRHHHARRRPGPDRGRVPKPQQKKTRLQYRSTDFPSRPSPGQQRTTAGGHTILSGPQLRSLVCSFAPPLHRSRSPGDSDGHPQPRQATLATGPGRPAPLAPAHYSSVTGPETSPLLLQKAIRKGSSESQPHLPDPTPAKPTIRPRPGTSIRAQGGRSPIERCTHPNLLCHQRLRLTLQVFRTLT
jgi:hypothetical protein